MKTKANKHFKEICLKKYGEMKDKKVTEDFLDEKEFGGLKIYINPNPPIKGYLLKMKNFNDEIIVGE